MTMPHERTRAVVQTHDFLVDLSRDTSLPERVRRDARFLLRHYPSRSDMLLAGRIERTRRYIANWSARPRIQLNAYALANTLSKL